MIDKTARCLSKAGAEQFKTLLLPPLSVVVSCIGSDMGKSALTTKPSITNQQINSIVVSSEYDPLFIYYNLSRRKRELQHLASGGSAQPIVNKSVFSNLSIDIPRDIDCQKRISSILAGFDDRIEQNRRIAVTLEDMARAIFKSWFVDFDPVIDNALTAGNAIPEPLQERAARRQEARAAAEAEGKAFGLPANLTALFPDAFADTDNGPLPSSWSLRSLSSFADLARNSIQPSTTPEAVFHHFSLPAFDVGRLPKLESGAEILSNKFKIKNGDILLSKLNPHIPRLWLPLVEDEARSVASTEFLVIRSQSGNDTAFLFAFLSQSRTISNLAALVNGTSNSHQRLAPNQVMASTMNVPDSALLKEFCQVATPLLQRAQQLRKSLRLLSETRDALLPQLISGSLAVPNVGGLPLAD